ncbi:MAG: hypothetical protein QOD85_2294 [Gaiellaceae bacterium]|jgi:hypothetical protein|nr:hypothetical protein [Gaiellaceae bacterium]
MPKLTTLFVVLLTVAALAAGCGSSSGGSGGSGGSKKGALPNGGGGVNGTTVGNCLNINYDFLVQPNPTSVDGQSPAGVNFTLRLYPTTAAAKAAAAKENAKTTAVVETGVVDFRGNPSIYKGAPPAKISKVELANIKACIDKAKAG